MHEIVNLMLAQAAYLQNFSSCLPACCSCQRARHWGCTFRGHLQGLIMSLLPSSEFSSKQIQHMSLSAACKEENGAAVSLGAVCIKLESQLSDREGGLRAVVKTAVPPPLSELRAVEGEGSREPAKPHSCRLFYGLHSGRSLNAS
jgi:hypothetical protein